MKYMIYSNVSNLSQYLEQHVYLKINKFLQQVMRIWRRVDMKSGEIKYLPE